MVTVVRPPEPRVLRDDVIARLKKIPGVPQNEWVAELLAREGQLGLDGRPAKWDLCEAVWVLVQVLELAPHGCRAEGRWARDPEQYGSTLREVFEFLDLPIPEDAQKLMLDVKKTAPFDSRRPGALPVEEWAAR